MNNILILKRFYTDKNTTLGCLTNNDLPFPLYTCELAWNNNEPYKSCIPSGEYIIKPHSSPKFGKCLLIEGIKNRNNILVHPGNTYKDSTGCILPGLQLGTLKGIPAVLQSKKAYELLQSIVISPDWKLKIFPFD